MSTAPWRQLPAGPALRRIIAERLGWHMRRVWVSSDGVEYDCFVYDHEDRIVYHQALTADDLTNEQAAIERIWHAAMQDENCPLWDEDPDEAQDLAYGMMRKVWRENGSIYAWVRSTEFTGEAESEPLAIVRAWLAATENDPAYFH